VNDSYQQLIEHADEMTARISMRYSGHLLCRAGCSGCCHHHLSVFPVEADAVRRAMQSLPDKMRARISVQADAVTGREARNEPIACPMLVDDKCAIYESRPLICRTQGLPLLIEADDGSREVDFCPLNFTAPDAVDDLVEDHLVPLDAINLRLAMVNLQDCREKGIDPSTRVKMADIIRAAQLEPQTQTS
jgi:uncharacterized protein